jgi:hypothetical protein
LITSFWSNRSAVLLLANLQIVEIMKICGTFQ